MDENAFMRSVLTRAGQTCESKSRFRLQQDLTRFHCAVVLRKPDELGGPASDTGGDPLRFEFAPRNLSLNLQTRNRNPTRNRLGFGCGYAALGHLWFSACRLALMSAD